MVNVTDAQSLFCGQTVVEFEHGSSLTALEALPLPYRKHCQENPEIVYQIQSLAKVYSDSCGSTTTKSYLSELKQLAKLSGKEFADILKDELSRISDSVTDQPVLDVDPLLDSQRPSPPCEPKEVSSNEFQRDSHRFPENAGVSPQTTEVPASTFTANATRPSVLSASHLTTPEVQRVVVEHVVRSGELASQLHSPLKLKPFSGRVPHQNFEADYDTWRATVNLYLNDPVISDAQVVRKIIESLSPPASNIIKPLGPLAPPQAYLDVLDSAFAAVGDGDELFAAFLNLNQNSGEKPSDYLHRLQTALMSVIKSNGIAAVESDKQLLRQFCRGCWNNSLISNLQLEQRKQNPPTFPEFLLLLRTEEDRQIAKNNRMRQHLGATRVKSQPSVQVGCNPCLVDPDLPVGNVYIPSKAVEPLQKQIAKLQTQVAKLLARSEGKETQTKPPKRDKYKHTDREPDIKAIRPSKPSASTSRPKPWYCFKCGEDNHIAASCSKEPNPVLVQTKRKELREKQHAWDMQNAALEGQDLN
ncbi:hypothetical protein QQF64_028997 [Cirrhinus molitorella]|uniref:CCHC-type domain-containing protein n=1 Tax=Cirrhinus molitorella TaxID=172907 RepID=A0ABR3N893_9TELE